MVTAQTTRSWDYGIYQVSLDGAAGPSIDLYNDGVTQAPVLSLGTRDLTEGRHEIKFEAKSKNPSSKGYYFGLDYIELIPV